MTIQKFGRGLLIYTVAFASAFTTRYVVRSIRNSTTWSTSEIQSKTQFASNVNNKNFSGFISFQIEISLIVTLNFFAIDQRLSPALT